MNALKRLIILFTILYIVTILSGYYFYVQGKSSQVNTEQELTTTKSLLESQKTIVDNLKTKISLASANVRFLSLALCPTLESSDKNSLCVTDNNEWFSQTMLAGSMISDPDTKTKMDSLLVALGAKTKPTAKQLYEMLKPIEINSLKALNESLK